MYNEELMICIFDNDNKIVIEVKLLGIILY